MPWVTFTDDFDFSPTYGVTYAFKASDQPVLVTTRCAELAKRRGAAKEARAPKGASKDEVPVGLPPDDYEPGPVDEADDEAEDDGAEA